VHEARIIGRVDESDPAGPRFSWPGTRVVARFDGTAVAVRLHDPGNRFDVELDGKALPVLRAHPGRQRYQLAAGLPSGPHDLILHRRTEASFGETRLLGLDVDGAILPPPPPAARRLEFIGDSITCGWGLEAADRFTAATADNENHARTFAALTARALAADAITIAWSGKGLVRNYAGDSVETIPVLHDRTLAERAQPRWDFTRFVPHAVVINLGSNDFAHGDPGPAFATAYQSLLRAVRTHYPDAFLLAALGPVMPEEQVRRARAYLESTITALSAPRLAYLEFPRQDGTLGYGSDWHPSAATHSRMADQLTAELRRLLGW
jgi:lysophospholipase L1-like esterase